MADPLSITASVLTLITVSVKVTFLLKQFRDETSDVDATLTGLLGDISNLQQVLESMRETFNHDEIKANLQATGHAGNHWRNLARSLEDGAGTLRQLANLLEGVNKTTSFLDGPRKQIRFRSAIDQMAIYREQIQSYRAALQLSLSTVLLWNQVNIQKSTDKISEKVIPTLDKLYDEFRSFGALLNAKIEKLQKAVASQNDRDAYEELTSMSNLRECVRAAADVVSTASSTLTVDASDRKSVKHGSDFGDLFAQDANETMMRWMSSNTVYEYEEMSPRPDLSEASTGDTRTEYPSDSDSDLETDIFRALFNNAKRLMAEGDLIGAERKLCNCLSRLNANASTYSLKTAAANELSRAELLERLIEVYCLLSSWPKAKAMMMDKLSITERQVGKKDELYLTDLLKLGEIMVKNREYVEAHLQGRRSLGGFKKLGKSGFDGYEKALIFLVDLCSVNDKGDEEEAYAALLGSHRAAMKLRSDSSISQDTLQRSTALAPEIASAKNPLHTPNIAYGQSTTSDGFINEQNEADGQLTGDYSNPDTAVSNVAMTPAEGDLKDVVVVDHGIEVPSGHGASDDGLSIVTLIKSPPDDLASKLRLQSEATDTPPRMSNSSVLQRFTTSGKNEDLTHLNTLSHAASSEADSENAIVIKRRISASSNGSTRNEISASVHEAPQSARSTPGISVTSAQRDLDSEDRPEDLPITGSYTTHDSGLKIGGPCHHEASHVRGAYSISTPVRFRPHSTGGQELKPIDKPELASDSKNHATSTGVAETLSAETDREEQLIRAWNRNKIMAATFLDEWYQTQAMILSESPFDIVTTFCRTRYGQVPYLTTTSYPEGWTCCVLLRGKRQYVVHGIENALMAKEEAATLYCEQLVDPIAKDLMFRGYKLRDPCSDKEVVVVESGEEKWVEAISLKRPSLVASSSSGAPVIAVSSEPFKSSWSSMFGRFVPHSSSEPRLPRTPDVDLTHTTEGRRTSYNTIHKHRREIPLLDGHLTPRSADSECTPNDDLEGSEPVYDETPTCPVCNESLSGLSESSKSTHVNSCIDGAPIPISELRIRDEVPATPIVITSSDVVNSINYPRGTWICAYCKPKHVQILGNDTCTQCGSFRANHYRSSANSFVRRPFEPIQYLPTAQNKITIFATGGNVVRRKILLLGDTRCGKTWLASSWCHNKVLEESDTPSLKKFIYQRKIEYGGVKYTLELDFWDNNGMDIHERLRRLSYENVDLVLICFDISEPDSLENVQYVWQDEANDHLRGVPKILVGCKIDLRNDVRKLELHRKHNTNPVSPHQADYVAMCIGAAAYFETSALKKAGINELFDYVSESFMQRPRTKNSSRTANAVRTFLAKNRDPILVQIG